MVAPGGESTSAPVGKSAHVDTFCKEHLPPPALWPEMDYSTLPELAAIPAQVNCASLLDRNAAAHPERPALLFEGRTWSYAELRDAANRIAHVLVDDLGVLPGHRVMLRAPNNPMMVACWFAVMKAGAVAVATMPLLRWRELAYIADKASVALALCDRDLRENMQLAAEMSEALCRILLFDGAGAGASNSGNVPAGDTATETGRAAGDATSEPDEESLEALMRERAPEFDNVDTAADDVALIAFTSGTTGQPKGTVHFHRDVLAACECFPRLLGATPDDVFCGSPPLAFTFGLGGLVLFPMHAGAATCLVEKPVPETLLESIAAAGVTVLFTAPTAYRAMLGLLEGHDISSLRVCVSAGEPLPAATWEAWREATGIRIIDGIGTTEMLHIFIAAAGDEIRPGATGRPVPGYQARVLGDDLEPLPAGEVGQLAVRGPTGCRYLADERQSDYVADGWNLTGDAYVVDEDGYFYFRSRTDDMIVSSGYNIAGIEVEDALNAHPVVLECGVVGVADEARGQLVKAFVVVEGGVGLAADEATLRAELQEFVKQRIAPYKYPRAIEFVERLPRTGTGKVQRFRLRERG